MDKKRTVKKSSFFWRRGEDFFLAFCKAINGQLQLMLSKNLRSPLKITLKFYKLTNKRGEDSSPFYNEPLVRQGESVI